MRTRLFNLLIAGYFIAILAAFISPQQDKFYYAFDEKISLTPKKNTLLVKYTEEADKKTEEQFLKSLSPNVKLNWHKSLTVEITTTSEKSKNELMEKLKAQKEVYTCQPFYTLEGGLDMGVTDEIIVKFLLGVSNEKKDSLREKYKTTVIETTKIYQLLRVSKGTDALEIANKLYESGLLKFSHPNFIPYAELFQVIPNDTYFNYQITCHNTKNQINYLIYNSELKL